MLQDNIVNKIDKIMLEINDLARITQVFQGEVCFFPRYITQT